MFTAIALIAFSSVSMGNTIADENVVNLDNKNNQIEDVKKNPCIEKAIDRLDCILENCPDMPDTVMHNVWQALIADC